MARLYVPYPRRRWNRRRFLLSVVPPSTLLVVGNTASLNTTDSTWKGWLEDLGHNVTTRNGSAAEDQNYDLIVISESVSSGDITGSNKYFPDASGDPPVLEGEQAVWDNWGFSTAGGTNYPNESTVEYVNDTYIQWTGHAVDDSVTVFDVQVEVYGILEANESADLITIVDPGAGTTDSLVGWLPSGSSTNTPNNDPTTAPMVQWGLCGISATPTSNANAEHEQLFKDSIKALLTAAPAAAGAGGPAVGRLRRAKRVLLTR